MLVSTDAYTDIGAQRLPASSMNDVVLIEQEADSITLRSENSKKLSWTETAAAMAKGNEGWAGFETANADGLNTL